MTITFLSLDQMALVYKIEQDWLFDKLLAKLKAHSHLILSADRGRGLQEYVTGLGLQLSERNPDIHIYYMDIQPAHCPASFLEIFMAALSHRFPEVTSGMKMDSNSMDILRLPASNKVLKGRKL